MVPLFFFWACRSWFCFTETTKNIPFRINHLGNAILVSLFYSNSCVIDGGMGAHLKKLDRPFPIPYSLSFHIIAHSFALFCTL